VTPPGRGVGTPYRLASAGESSRDLEELLRSRLRIATALGAFTAAGLGAATFISNLGRIRLDLLAAFTIPPFAVPMLCMAIGMAIVWVRLSPRHSPALGWLRRVEWAMTAAWASFFVIIVTGDLRVVLHDLPHLPIDLAMAHSSMWGLMLVALGTMVPTTPRAGAIRSAAIIVASWIPDVVVGSTAAVLPDNWVAYLGTATVMTVFYAGLGIYGGYRIETLRRDAQAARQLGQYLLTRPLGSGGMGEVYLAEHRLLKRPCAVKLIRPEQAGDALSLQRFEREAQATAALTHPATVQVYDYGIAEDGTFYYVMEYLPGITLEELLAREGPQPPKRVIHILSQLCGALQEAHTRGLVHRDIKPGNVMLGERSGVGDVAKLLDFGLVAPIRSGSGVIAEGATTQSGMILGTPEYMSPEQCGGDGEIGPASDLYSLGALAFTLLTGRSPFAGRGALPLLGAHLHEAPPRAAERRPEVPRGLAEVVARCLAKQPGERFPDAAGLARALAEVAGEVS
jgi:serine/threonine-protein kinase